MRGSRSRPRGCCARRWNPKWPLRRAAFLRSTRERPLLALRFGTHTAGQVVLDRATPGGPLRPHPSPTLTRLTTQHNTHLTTATQPFNNAGGARGQGPAAAGGARDRRRRGGGPRLRRSPGRLPQGARQSNIRSVCFYSNRTNRTFEQILFPRSPFYVAQTQLASLHLELEIARDALALTLVRSRLVKRQSATNRIDTEREKPTHQSIICRSAHLEPVIEALLLPTNFFCCLSRSRRIPVRRILNPRRGD